MSLIVWLPLNGDFNNNGTDSSYTPSIASGNSWVSSGKIGTNSLKMTNIQQVLAANTSKMSGAKEISYCYWVKVNTAWSANWLDGIRWIETDGSTTSTARQEFYTNCTLIGTWYKGGSISGKSFTPGVWTHLAATFNYNTGEAKFYINGILSGSTTNIDKTYYCRGDFYIGDNGVDICENDVRIYDHCLSAAEVHEISQGLVLHYKLDDITNNIQDSSGYNRNGIPTGLTTSSDTSRYSYSTVFNGTTDVITISNQKLNTILNSACTIAFWIKPISENGGRSIYFSSYNGSPFWCIEKSASNAFRYDWNGSPDQYSGGVIADNTWQHLCLVRESTAKAYFYLNGELKTTFTTATSDLSSLVDTWRIGRDVRTNDGTPYHGHMSDFRIYCTALSAADVKALYEVGAKVDNLQNLHTFEIKETNRNLLAGRLWSNQYSQHNPSAGLFTNFNSKGEYQFTANSTSAGTEYIPINPTGHTYEYDYTISVNTGNQFYIGFERYDANKTARSNNACVYTYATKPSSDVVKQHFKGIVDLSTDGTNPCAFIALRILNGWSSTTSGVTGTATIHNISLRETGIKQQPKLTKQGQFIEEELKEETNMKLHKNGIVEVNNLIEF